jgi:hypothetical protein
MHPFFARARATKQMRIVTASDNGIVKVTWFEGRRVVGVWGEQRARCSIDAMCDASEDGGVIAVAMQNGNVVFLGVADAVASMQVSSITV